MPLTGSLYLGSIASAGRGPAVHAIEAATGNRMEPPYPGATRDQLETACAQAEAAFDDYRGRPMAERAAFLEAIADAIVNLGDELIVRCMAESGLPRGRLEGERGRTVSQLRLFAEIVRSGEGFDRRFDAELPERQPARRPDLRMKMIPLGPVAVFGASNFPLAFSVAGGDTASALAAGCPVVVKAHPAHPGTSELIGSAIARAVRTCGMPGGVFSLLFGAGNEIGSEMVADPRIKAVGFTGSRAGGTALMRIAQERVEPIPVYAEMSAINPVLLMPHALDGRAEEIADAFVGALVLGAGQFCTNPGLLLAIDSAGLDRFIGRASAAVGAAPAATMLTPNILRAYEERVATLQASPSVTLLAQGPAGGSYDGAARLFRTDAAAFMSEGELREECFGAASLLVRCRDVEEMAMVLRSLDGQLTAAVHAAEGDFPDVRALMPILERKVGRILFGGFGTGVEVARAMVHGGPFPATSDGRTTSVGTKSVERFLRPVCYQDVPTALLPTDLAA